MEVKPLVSNDLDVTMTLDNNFCLFVDKVESGFSVVPTFLHCTHTGHTSIDRKLYAFVRI